MKMLTRLVTRPPLFYRQLFPEGIWRVKMRGAAPKVFLTFDDGPIPEETPWVLDTLDRYNIKATFFMVGENVCRNPGLFEEIKKRGHSWGNHTMHHLQGMKVRSVNYLRDLNAAHSVIQSILFRPPHGIIRWAQAKVIKNHYNIVMYDLVTRDYSRKLSPDKVFENVRRYTRNGSIIVFHDSLKARKNIMATLPRAIEWLQSEGYEFARLPM